MADEVALTYKINSQQLDAANQATINGTRLAAQAEKELQALIAKRAGVAQAAAQGTQPPPLPPQQGGSQGTGTGQQSQVSSLRDLSGDERTKIAAAMASQRKELIGLLTADRKAAVGKVEQIDSALTGIAQRQPIAERQQPVAGRLEQTTGALSGAFGTAISAVQAYTAVTQYAAVRLQDLNAKLTDPYATKGEKTVGMIEAVPLFGDLYAAAMKLRENLMLTIDSDKRDMLSIMQLRMAESPARSRYNISVNQFTRDTNERQQFANERVDLVENFMKNFPSVGAIDRSTAMGAVEFREQLQMLPVRRQANQADMNVVDLRQKYGSLQLARNTEEAEFAAAKKEAEDATKSAVYYRSQAKTLKGYDPARQTEATRRATEAQARMDASAARLAEITKQQRDIKENQLPAARDAARQAAIGVKSAQLDQTQTREDYAADRAKSLTYMGVEGRAQSQMAYQVLQQVGIANAPAQLIAEARGYAPRTVDKQAEAAGEQFSDVARQVAPDDYRDKLSEIRKDADRQRKELDDAVVEAAKLMATDTASAIKDAIKTMTDVFQKILDTELQKVKTEALLRNLGQK